MRHGEAEASFSNDKQRQLTDRGRTQVADAARQIASLLPDNQRLDLALVSPYKRTQQTFEVLSHTLAVEHRVNSDLFTPMSSVAQASDMIHGYCDETVQSDRFILVVSHMPLVSFLTAELTTLDVPPIFSTSAFAVIDIKPSTLKGHLVTLNQQHA